jgi:hypothetical protein
MRLQLDDSIRRQETTRVDLPTEGTLLAESHGVRAAAHALPGAADPEGSTDIVDAVAGSEFVDDRIRLEE